MYVLWIIFLMIIGSLIIPVLDWTVRAIARRIKR